MKVLCIALALLACLLYAVIPASAQGFDWTPTVIYAGGRAVDQWSTHRFLSNGSGCVEGTAILGPRPSAAKLTAYNAGGVAVVAFGGYLLHRAFPDHPILVRRLNLVLGIGGGAIGVHTAVANGRNCPARTAR